MHDDQDEQRRLRAYAIWEREGRPDGRDQQHWAMAGEPLAAPSDTPLPAAPLPADQPVVPADSAEAGTAPRQAGTGRGIEPPDAG